jgi:hypothetical protein
MENEEATLLNITALQVTRGLLRSSQGRTVQTLSSYQSSFETFLNLLLRVPDILINR